MKWLVGYQLTEDDAFMEEMLRQRDRIAEVYFSWGHMPNGRHAAAAHANLTDAEAQRRTEMDLQTLADQGIHFNLLLNGNCYGGRSLSRRFLMEVCDCIDEIGSRFGLSSVTTTSPVLAEVIRRNFSDLEIRASVNMEIGTVAGMEYLADRFDGFYLARELNRDIPKLTALRSWCTANGKKSYLLANSGCLNHCSARQFHDNLVAHEREIAEMNNGAEFHGICGGYLRRAADKSVLLLRLNFIRPEDVGLYEDLADGIKLATRVNRMPAQVLRAYGEGHYAGNLLDLLEPDHAEAFYPYVLENSRLPADFGRTVAYCGQRCESDGGCEYCRRALAAAQVRIPDYAVADGGEACAHHTKTNSERGDCSC